uniref:SRR1-like domain-containing protein n=1 Tax=Panagrolaimus davidi TaxID=227884 RepID=A0A914PDC2_9BILA
MENPGIETVAQNICQTIETLITKEEKVVLEIFGIGKLNDEDCMYQLQLAIGLLKRLKQKHGDIVITSGEPLHVEAEKNFLQKSGIQSRKIGFSNEDFINSATGADSIAICYMIHCSPDIHEAFIAANKNNLNQIIFVGNKPEDILIEGKRVKLLKDPEMIQKVIATADLKSFDVKPLLPKFPINFTWIYRFKI